MAVRFVRLGSCQRHQLELTGSLGATGKVGTCRSPEAQYSEYPSSATQPCKTHMYIFVHDTRWTHDWTLHLWASSSRVRRHRLVYLLRTRRLELDSGFSTPPQDGMLRRWSMAPRRALASSLPLARPRVAARPVVDPKRTVSLWPWRRNRAAAQAPIPIYFSRGGPILRPGNWRGPLGYGPFESRSTTHADWHSRVLFSIVAYTVCWQIYVYVVFDPLLDWADSEWNALSEKEKDEMDKAAASDEPILFLPFPFMTKLVAQPPYKGSDPEWSTFVAVSRDQQIQKDIKRTLPTCSYSPALRSWNTAGGLAETIRSAAAKNPQYAKALGGQNIIIRKYWLDILYPPKPPPKHYMSG